MYDKRENGAVKQLLTSGKRNKHVYTCMSEQTLVQ